VEDHSLSSNIPFSECFFDHSLDNTKLNETFHSDPSSLDSSLTGLSFDQCCSFLLNNLEDKKAIDKLTPVTCENGTEMKNLPMWVDNTEPLFYLPLSLSPANGNSILSSDSKSFSSTFTHNE
jgi:hypothetical protein